LANFKEAQMSRDRRWILAFAIIVCVLTSLPYLLAFLNQDPGWEFTGFLIGVEDGNSYIAKMLSGAQGDWLFRSPYSSALQTGALLYLPYLLLGKLLGPSAQHGNLVLLFHLFRLVAIFALSYATYDFIGLFLTEEKLRRLGTALAILGGGFGWLLAILGQGDLFGSIPLDFYSPEAFGFLALFGLPHLILSRALLLLGLLLFLQPPRAGSWKQALPWLGLALTHAITAALGLLIVATYLATLYLLKRMKDVKLFAAKAVWIGLGAGPVLAVNLSQLFNDPYLQAWSAQNQILSPHPLHYLFAWGFLLPFALIGIRYLLKKDSLHGIFLTVWLALLPFLLYIPMGLQRRFSEGALVLLTILAIAAFEGSWQKNQRALWLFGLAFPTTILLLVGASFAAAIAALPIFRPSAETAVFRELRARSTLGEIVLAAYETGNALPAWVPLRVLIGHGPETVGLGDLLPQVAEFYREETPDAYRLDLISSYEIDYVFLGPAERTLGSWMPEQSGFLELLFESNGYSVFRVVND
jgi:hypothetical protein